MKSFEKITGEEFKPESGDVIKRIEENLKKAKYL